MITLVKTEQDHERAMCRILTLMDQELIAGSKEEAELEVLSVLVDLFEKEFFPIGRPDPIEAIKFRMKQMNLSNKDMEPYLGSLSRVSEVLNRKRGLSISMIRRLHEGLGIPADVLILDSVSGRI